MVAASCVQSPRPGLHGRNLIVLICLVTLALALTGAALAAGPTRRPVPPHPAARPDRDGRTGTWCLSAPLVFIAASSVLVWVQPNGAGAGGVLLGFALLARYLSESVGTALSVAALVALITVKQVSGHGPNVWLLAFIGGFFGMVFLAYRLAVANEQAERLVVALQQSRAAEAQAAGLAERQRLAREMHDVLAHSLSGLLLHLEGARMLAAHSPDDPRLPAIIDRAHRLARSGLDEARQVIGTLRGDELPGPERLAGLAEQFQSDVGVPCRFTVNGTERPLSSQVSLAVYRVAQEALTNITKHAHPESVQLRLAYAPGLVRLTVEDFASDAGDARDEQSGGSGYGLTGMRERAELLGGTLTAQATGDGFRVELGVPA
jgi:signal transduction histidine kinase